MARVVAQQPIYRVTGDLTIVFGNTTYLVKGVVFESPRTGQGVYTVTDEPITAARQGHRLVGPFESGRRNRIRGVGHDPRLRTPLASRRISPRVLRYFANGRQFVGVSKYRRSTHTHTKVS